MMASEANGETTSDDPRVKSSKSEPRVVQANVSPDGGWGWVVVFGSFMIHVIADGVAYSFGIYVESFLYHFNATRSEVGFLGSLMVGVTWGTGPIASMLTNKYGCRKTTICGTIVAAVGFVISIFAPNIYFMYFSFGVLAGFGLGMAYLPAIVAVSFYFEKRRSLATGLAVCGSGIGTFIFAPLTQHLLDNFGWKGTVLIEAGILLNCIICGAVFRPLPAVVEKPASAVDARNANDVEETLIKASRSDTSLGKGNEKKTVDGDKVVNRSDLVTDKNHLLSQSTASVATRAQSLRKELADKKISSSEMQLARGKVTNRSAATVSSESVTQSPLARKDIFYTASLQNIPAFRSDPVSYRQSVVSVQQIPDSSGKSGRMLETLRTMMDCRLMINIIFQLFAISNLLTSIGYYVPYTFLPNRATMRGMAQNEGAFLISIIGVSNTIGRIVFGFLADFKWVNRLFLYNTALVLCGIASLLSALCHSYPLMATYAAVFGLLMGVYICLTPIVIVDLLGLERLSNAFGLVLLYQGIGTIAGATMAGAIYDSTLDYDNSFHLAGACIAISGAMLYCIPCVQRCRGQSSASDTALPTPGKVIA